MIKGTQLISAIYRKPHILPLESHPQAVFFLLNFEVFSRSWDMWLAYGLEDLGYDVRKPKYPAQLTEFHILVIWVTRAQGFQKFL